MKVSVSLIYSQPHRQLRSRGDTRTPPPQSAWWKSLRHPRHHGIGSLGCALTLAAIVLQVEAVVIGVSNQHHVLGTDGGVVHRSRLRYMGDDVSGVVNHQHGVADLWQ